MTNTVFLTDLDHCLSDRTRDAIENARPAIEALRSDGIPLILLSGKTRAQIEPLRQRLNHRDPFIVENGAAVFVPLETFDFPLARSRRRSSYQVIELGTPYALLRDVLRQIEETVKSTLRGFGDLSLDEIMDVIGVDRDEALRAKLREYDEPFLMKGPDSLMEEVQRQIAARGLSWRKGEHFFHLTGANNPARAAELLLRCYRHQWDTAGIRRPMELVFIGEKLNDFPPMLNADHPFLAQKPNGSDEAHAEVPRLIPTSDLGPAAWNHVVLNFLKQAA